MKDYHINVFYSEEDGGYIADIPDLKYCSAFGNTPVEAVTEVLIGKEAWLATAPGSGQKDSAAPVQAADLPALIPPAPTTAQYAVVGGVHPQP